MKRNLLVGCIVLIFVGISTIRANSEQCNAMFGAVVDMRGNLTAFLKGDQAEEKALKKTVFYWTNVNIDDDVHLRRLVCQVVNANSLDEMAAAMRIPRIIFFYLYREIKWNAARNEMGIEEMLLLYPPERVTEARRQAMRAYYNMMRVAQSSGLLRFNAPPPTRDPRLEGCHTMMELGLPIYNDRALFLSADPIRDRIRTATGIDIENRDQIKAVLCKLGEVSDLTELAAVYNMPVGAVRGFYPFIVSSVRKLEGVIASGKVPPGVPQHFAQNMLKYLRGMKEVGLLDLTD